MSPWAALRAVVIFVYVFMLGPILITAAVSFNASNRSQFPPRGFSPQWWQRAFSAEWVEPLVFSFKLAALAALISTALALPLAFGLSRHRFPGRAAIAALTLGPLMLPALVTGVGLLQLFQYVGLRDYLGFSALLIGHVVICVPFAVTRRDAGSRVTEPKETFPSRTCRRVSASILARSSANANGFTR